MTLPGIQHERFYLASSSPNNREPETPEDCNISKVTRGFLATISAARAWQEKLKKLRKRTKYKI
jgi:hypothetical protein